MTEPLTVGDGVLALALVWASYTDLTTGKIRNRLTFPLLGVALVYQGLFGDFQDGLLGAGIGFALHFGLWMLGVERGGDAKLMIGVGAMLGWSTLLEATLWMYILLLPIGLGVLVARGRLQNFFETVRYAAMKAAQMPAAAPKETTMLSFGPVIAAATVTARLTDWLVFWSAAETGAA